MLREHDEQLAIEKKHATDQSTGHAIEPAQKPAEAAAVHDVNTEDEETPPHIGPDGRLRDDVDLPFHEDAHGEYVYPDAETLRGFVEHAKDALHAHLRLVERMDEL